MKKTITIAILLTLTAVFVPASASANVTASVSNGTGVAVQPRKHKVGRRHDRGKHRGWHNGRRIQWYHYAQPSYVRQVYWYKGRPYYRWYRYY